MRSNVKDILKQQRQKGSIAPGVHPGIGLDQLKQLRCTCGNELFIPCCHAYYASTLQSVTGTPTLVQVPQGFVCASCAKQNEFDKEALGAKKEESDATGPQQPKPN